MPKLVARILQVIDVDGLLKLAVARRLPGRRSESELRQTLSVVYGDSIRELISDLQREDLQRLLQRPFRWQGNRYFSPEPALYSKEQLLKFADSLFVQGKMPAEFGKEFNGAEFDLEPPRPVPSPKPPAIPLDDDDGKTVVAPGMRLLIGLTHDWSRPRMLRSVLEALDLEVPERLRAPRFQEVVKKLMALGVEISDADSGALLTPRDSSPGIDAKVRLRRRQDGVQR